MGLAAGGGVLWGMLMVVGRISGLRLVRSFDEVCLAHALTQHQYCAASSEDCEFVNLQFIMI